MVDPNRKINRLTDKDIEFLEECEEEFSQRYTKADAEFQAHCAKPLPPPPIIENWSHGGGGGGGGGHYSNRTSDRHNQRNWRGGGRKFHNWKNNRRSRPYEYNNRTERETTNSKTNIRRDYNNFVAASQE